MRVRRALLAFCATLHIAGVYADQAVLHLAIGDNARKDREVGLVLDGITDTATGDVIDPAALAARLADVGLLFLGETHTNSGYHEVQLRVIRELHRAGREVLIGLEMFPYTQQASLDAWIDGHYTERGFVEQAEWYTYWGYRWEYYRDIFNFAREQGVRMYAINTPRDVVKAVRIKGFKDLTPEEAAHIPREVKPVTDDQKRMYTGFFDADDALHVSDKMIDGMLRAHTTWDATMGWNALQALVEHGGDNAIMVVLIGLGHVSYGLGAERQVAPYYDGRIASVIPLEVRDGKDEPVETVRASFANFLWGLPKEAHTVYPTLGVSLMGEIGDQPTKLIQVSKESIAERAGLEIGDVLLAVDGHGIDSGATLRRVFAPYRWGDVLIARIERDGEEREVVIPIRRSSGETGDSEQE
jgi:uncharacterized iron-regulated protein